MLFIITAANCWNCKTSYRYSIFVYDFFFTGGPYINQQVFKIQMFMTFLFFCEMWRFAANNTFHQLSFSIFDPYFLCSYIFTNPSSQRKKTKKTIRFNRLNNKSYFIPMCVKMNMKLSCFFFSMHN